MGWQKTDLAQLLIFKSFNMGSKMSALNISSQKYIHHFVRLQFEKGKKLLENYFRTEFTFLK